MLITRTARGRARGWTRCWSRHPRSGCWPGRCSRCGSCPAWQSSPNGSSSRGRQARAGARRSPGGASAAALHPRRAPAHPRRGARHVRLRACRHLDAAARAIRPRTRPAPTSGSTRPIRRARSRPWGLGEALRAAPRCHGGQRRSRMARSSSAPRSATGRCWASTDPAMADVVRVREDAQGAGDARCAPGARSHPRRRARDPHPRRDAAGLARRRFGVRADRGIPPVPRRRHRRGLHPPGGSTPTAGSCAFRARPARSSRRASAARPR